MEERRRADLRPAHRLCRGSEFASLIPRQLSAAEAGTGFAVFAALMRSALPVAERPPDSGGRSG